MILIRDVVDEIINYCFDDELKQILESTISGNKVTVKSQFLYYYRHACYRGTKDELKQDMLYRIQMNMDLLLRLKDFKENMSRIFDLDDYSKVRFKTDESLATEGRISNSANYRGSSNKVIGNSGSIDQGFTDSVNDQSSGVSETNELEKLEDVILNPEDSQKQFELEVYNLKQEQIESTEETFSQNRLKPSSKPNPVYYQHFTKNLSIDNTNSLNVNKSTSATDGLNIDNSKYSSSSTKGSKTDGLEREVKYVNHEARIKAWTEEIPRITQRFWRIFHNLFHYEHL